MIVSRLTTDDNPYDPFDQFQEWLLCDSRLGYHTGEYLARVLITSYDMSEPDQQQRHEQAINEIIADNPYGPWKKISRDVGDRTT